MDLKEKENLKEPQVKTFRTTPFYAPF